MNYSDRIVRHRLRSEAAEKAEAEGKVADSLHVRMELLAKADRGEMTLQEVQAELKRIKRNAKKNGLITRNQAYLKG